ncbi:GNAT family N-acetyltransferase [Streptomyces eurythermus]|uniref:GNAT family N-acetyltransferase n=1 Tax=Streptomyces eurythermus TaxID=42237 RepID=UPI0033D42C6B
MAAINADPEVIRWIRDGSVRDEQQTRGGLAAEAAVRFGFEERGLERIVSITQVGNDASERIMTKLGMHPVRETVNPIGGRRVRVFELSSDQYVTTTR